MVLDTIFGFLLSYAPVVSVTVFSIIVLVLINIFYKILINQNEAKQLKERTKELGKQMREQQKSGNTQKSNELLSEMMRENSRLMRMSMKPMIISFIIVILLLPWLADNYGDRIVAVENNVGNLKFDGNEYAVQLSEDGKIVNVENYANCELPCTATVGNMLFEISRENQNIKFAPVVASLPVPLPLFGTTMGWLGWYILVSVPLVMLIRKFMRIHV